MDPPRLCAEVAGSKRIVMQTRAAAAMHTEGQTDIMPLKLYHLTLAPFTSDKKLFADCYVL